MTTSTPQDTAPGAGRSEIIERIGSALGTRGRAEAGRHASPPRSGGQQLSGEETIERLTGRLSDYGARVRHVDSAAIGPAVSAALGDEQRVVIPVGLDRTWPGPRHEVVVDDGTLSAGGLDAFDAVVTECRLAIAETGTIVCDGGPGQGRRAITLVPDHHVCIRRRSQVVRGVADAVAALDPTRPLTWISGPSATVDIELVRVQGVHGPRRLDVVIVDDTKRPDDLGS